MPEDHDGPTDGDSLDLSKKTPGSSTWWGKVIRRQDRREEASDARIDGAWSEALAAAKDSATSAWRVVKFQWGVIALLILSVVALAGYSIGFEIPGGTKIEIGQP